MNFTRKANYMHLPFCVLECVMVDFCSDAPEVADWIQQTLSSYLVGLPEADAVKLAILLRSGVDRYLRIRQKHLLEQLFQQIACGNSDQVTGNQEKAPAGGAALPVSSTFAVTPGKSRKRKAALSAEKPSKNQTKYVDK